MAETLTEQPYVDPHHRVPDDQWGQIVRDARAFREEHEAAQQEAPE